VDLSSFTLSGGLPKEAGVGATARPVSMTPEPSAMSTENQVSLPPNRRSSLTDLEFVPGWQGLSAWSGSLAKRIFDCACVLLSAPVVLPLMLITALTVRLTSPGPVFFLQERIGRFGRPFTIFKFRTMMHTVGTPHRPIAIPDSSCFTSVGPFLRRWKLDELPQLINVLLGHMSLVGPRPKMREHVRYDLPCRPGITGMATIVFACEEDILASLAKDQVEEYFHAVVLPAKRRLDANYMSRATFLSDLQLLVNSVLRRWDSRALEEIAVAAAFGIKQALAPETGYRPVSIARQKPKPIRTEPTADAEEVTLM
jgi:lipopolysaccharide/colanic/teichoic acid biosynthesis glycosyltransferase